MNHPQRRLRVRRRLVALAIGVLGILGTVGVSSADASPASPNFLQNQYTGLCMSIGGNDYHDGALVDQYTCGGFPDQYYWTFESTSHRGYYYVVLDEEQDLCLTHRAPFTTSQLTVSSCGWHGDQGTQDQLWYDVVDQNFGSAEMRSWVDDWCLSVPGASSALSIPINTYPCGPYPDQHWAFV